MLIQFSKPNIDAITRMLVILFVCLIEFRVFDNKGLSLADPIFLIISIVLFLNSGLSLVKLKPTSNISLIVMFSFFWTVSYLTPVFSYPSDEWLDFLNNNFSLVVGSIYLVMITLLFRYIVIKFGIKFVLEAIFYAGLINAIVAFFGLMLALFDIESGLVCLPASCTTAPYLEDMPRMVGFSLSPNGYAYSQFTALIAVLVLFFRGNPVTNISLLSLIIIAASLLLSFSQVFVLGGVVLFIWFSNKFVIKAYKKAALLSTLALTFLMYISITHFMVIHGQENCKFGNEILQFEFSENSIKICPSFFVQQKYMYVDIGIKNIPWGIGARNELVNSKFDPHSMYLERFSLHGLTGLTSLIIFIIITYNLLRKISGFKEDEYLYLALLLFWIMQLYIGINADILRYRELWVILGITLGACDIRYDRSKI
jgi:hypothetical protein